MGAFTVIVKSLWTFVWSSLIYPGYDKYQEEQVQSQKSAPVQQQEAQQETAEQEEEVGVVDPKLRDFTLIISKLLFQLSQL